MSDLWGPVDLSAWREVPSVSGRLATETDVAEGRAVFYIEASGDVRPSPYDHSLPSCVIVRAEGSDLEVPAIAIQAETLNGQTIAVGYRFLNGGNGIAMLPEIEFLTGPDSRFVE